MAGPSAGYGASVSYAPDSAGSPGSWVVISNMKAEQVKQTDDMLDTTSFDSGGNKDRIAGLRDVDPGTISGDANFSDTGQNDIRSAFASRAKIWLKVLHDGTNGYSFPCVVESITTAAKVDGLVTFEFTVKSKGAATAIP